MTGDRSVSPSFFSEAATIDLFSDDDETDRDCEQRRHLLDSCFLCKRRLIGDIFMYRGDTPFCSEECREDQMEIDEAEEVRRMCAWRKQQQQQLRSGSPKRKQACGRAAVVAG